MQDTGWEQILEAIQSGSGSIDDARRTVLYLLEVEERKPLRKRSGNILELEKILWELTALQFPDVKQVETVPFESIRAKILEMEKKPKRTWAARLAIVTPIALMLVFAGNLILNSTVLRPGASPDEQQYVVEDMTPGKAGIAANGAGETIHSHDYAEIATYLGYSPLMPTWLPEGWKLDHYEALRATNQINFTAFYIPEEGGEYLIYSHTRYDSSLIARSTYEQNENGDNVITPGGAKVYVMQNTGSTIASWKTEQTASALIGTLDNEVMLKIIDNIKEAGE